MLLLEAPGKLFGADSGRDGKGADVVRDAGAPWRCHEIRKTEIWLLVGFDRLLTEHGEPHALAAPRFIAPHHDVVAVAVGRPEPVHRPWCEELLVDDAIEERATVILQLSRGGAVALVVEDLRKLPFEIPGREEEGPVDVATSDLFEANVIDDPHPLERRRWHIFASPFDRRAVFPCNVEGNLSSRFGRCSNSFRDFSCSLRFFASSSARRSGLRRSDTTLTTRDASRTCTVLPSYAGCYLDCGVRPAGGRAAD